MQPQKVIRLARRRLRSRGSDNQPGSTEPEREGSETEPKEILRWEDDGGQMIIATEKGREEYSGASGKNTSNMLALDS